MALPDLMERDYNYEDLNYGSDEEVAVAELPSKNSMASQMSFTGSKDRRNGKFCRRRVIFPNLHRNKCLHAPAKDSDSIEHHHRPQHFSLPNCAVEPFNVHPRQSSDNHSEFALSAVASKVQPSNLDAVLREHPTPPNLPCPTFLSCNRVDAIQSVGTGKKQVLPSILKRRKDFYVPPAFTTDTKSTKASNPSLPSLASLSEFSQSSNEETSPLHHTSGFHQARKEADNDKKEQSRHTVSFDPRVWVREFERSDEECKCTWYTDNELGAFKRLAIQRILRFDRGYSTGIIPTGTGRQLVYRPANAKFRVVYSHAALALDEEPDEHSHENEAHKRQVMEREMRSILLVDSHDVCLDLLTKALKLAMPHVSITKTKSGQEALCHMKKESNKELHAPFDIIVVEQRLKFFNNQAIPKAPQYFSGSSLLQFINAEDLHQGFLCIGLSAHLAQDHDLLKNSGADFCWGKPPPRITPQLIDDLLRKLLLKRGKKDVASLLFGS